MRSERHAGASRKFAAPWHQELTDQAKLAGWRSIMGLTDLSTIKEWRVALFSGSVSKVASGSPASIELRGIQDCSLSENLIAPAPYPD